MQRRAFLSVLFSSLAALAQTPQRDPFDVAIQSYHAARAEGRYTDAAARREEARALLDATDPALAQFGNRAEMLANVYSGDGQFAKGRAILENSLSRAAPLGESNPVRIMLLNSLSDFWEQDRNLLKSVAFLEKAAAAAEAAPKASPAAIQAQGSRAMIVVGDARRFNTPSAAFRGPANAVYMYQRLAQMYGQLGRPQDVSRVVAKIRFLGAEGARAIGGILESQGDLDGAAAVWKQQAAQAANPQDASSAWSNLANLYRRQQRYEEAASALEQAIAALKSAKPNETVWARTQLADVLQEAGKTQDADQIYQRLLQEDPDQEVFNYANYLVRTQRGAQAESFLQNYLTEHSGLQPGIESNLLYTMANAAGSTGNTARAEQYRHTAQEKQTAFNQKAGDPGPVTSIIDRAMNAANHDNPDEAFSLALQAMDAPDARDREQLFWSVPNVASALAAKRQVTKAAQLYDRLLALTGNWSDAGFSTPVLNVAKSYAHFVTNEEPLRSRAPAAIDRYRDLLLNMRGSETGWREEVFNMTITYQEMKGGHLEAQAAGEELLAFLESVSGATSESCLHALDRLAQLYSVTQNLDRVIALHRQAVAVADAGLPAGDPRRVSSRMALVDSLVTQKQFDEAARIGEEALALAASARPSQTQNVAPRLAQIQNLREQAHQR